MHLTVVTRKMEVSMRLLRRASLVLGLLMAGSGASGQCRFKNATSTESITYRFSPEKTSDGMLLKIQMTFRLLADESAEVNIPSPSISDLHPDTAGTTIKDGPKIG